LPDDEYVADGTLHDVGAHGPRCRAVSLARPASPDDDDIGVDIVRNCDDLVRRIADALLIASRDEPVDEQVSREPELVVTVQHALWNNAYDSQRRAVAHELSRPVESASSTLAPVEADDDPSGVNSHSRIIDAGGMRNLRDPTDARAETTHVRTS